MLEIQRFVTEVIESIGGIVEPIEYCLVDAIIPNEYIDVFQDRSEFKLAFDFEVAQENPESEFVTFGSNVFNNILDIANLNAVSTIRYGVVDNLSCYNPETKILSSLHSDCPLATRVNILSQRNIMVPLVLFNFRVIYSSDIQVSEDFGIWINLYNNSVCDGLKNEKISIFFEKSPIYNYPLGKKYSICSAFDLAIKDAEIEAQNKAQNYYREDELQSELSRIKSYYSDLEAENEKRLSRKGLSEEKKNEIQLKTEALKLEVVKQLAEIKNKHEVKISVNLMNGIIYYVPFIEYSYELSSRKATERLEAIFNPILKCFE